MMITSSVGRPAWDYLKYICKCCGTEKIRSQWFFNIKWWGESKGLNFVLNAHKLIGVPEFRNDNFSTFHYSSLDIGTKWFRFWLVITWDKNPKNIVIRHTSSLSGLVKPILEYDQKYG